MSQGTARVVADRYRLNRELGRGGMGTVWQAHDILLGRDVAIKEIQIVGQQNTDPFIRRALREAQAAARLRHPSVVTVHDVVTDGGQPWLVMELISGRTLAEVIREHGPLTEQRTAEIGVMVLEALRAAHRAGIVHRDVKPANLMIEEDGHVILTDFGIAALDDATALTATGQMIGSPAYLAPERINGETATPSSDLWALGVTLYTAATGKSPFQREDTQSTIAAILTARPATPAHAGRLWPVIKGLLAKNPQRRMTAEEAAALLSAVTAKDSSSASPPRRFLRGRAAGSRRSESDIVPATAVAPPPTLALPTTPLHSTAVPDAGTSSPATAEGAFAPKQRYVVPVVLAAVVVTAGAIVVSQWNRPGDDHDSAAGPPSQAAHSLAAVRSPATTSGPPVRWGSLHARLNAVSNVNALDYSPDGRYLATGYLYDFNREKKGDYPVRIHDLHNGRVRSLAGHTGQVNSLAFSPDGRHLASGSDDKSVRVWDLQSGLSRTFYGHPGKVAVVSYSPDGQHVASGGPGPKVRVWDLGSGTARTLTAVTSSTYSLEYSPDGRHLAVVGAGSGDVQIWDLGTGSSRTLSGHTDILTTLGYSPDGRYLATSGYDETVRVWNLADGTSRRFTGHTASVVELVYSPDGRHLASIALDRSVRIWDLKTGKARVLSGVTPARDSVWTLAYHPGGQQLAISDDDRRVGIWSVPSS